MKIPKICHQVWIGPLPPPTKWMETWKYYNPDWKYVAWGNKKIFNRKWQNQKLIEELLRRYFQEVQGKGPNGQDLFTSAQGRTFQGEKATLFAWHIIADILRYEILYEHGGYMPGADSICIKPLEDRFKGNYELFTLNTGHLHQNKYQELQARYPDKNPQGLDKIRWERYRPENASPILAAAPKNKFLKQIIQELKQLDPHQIGEAVDTTGNAFMGRMITKYNPKKIKIDKYLKRDERTPLTHYSIHKAGTTKNTYSQGR